VGMYDLETGERLLAPDGAGQVWLESLTVDRPSAPVPPQALGMQHSADASFGELALLGYDLYKLGFAHEPQADLRPGDILHTNLYWQAAEQPSGEWQIALDLVSEDGQEPMGLTAEPVSGYPTSRWQAGDVWRGQFNLPLPGDLPSGRYRLRVQPIAPDGSSPEPFLSDPFNIGK
jgi:mannosyltransferase